MTCLPIAESEDFLQDDMIRTSAEDQDAYIVGGKLGACVDAAFGPAFDAVHCNLVEVWMAFVHNSDFTSFASPDSSAHTSL